MARHIIRRGTKYHFVCRIPADLLHLFPSPIVSRSLHTTDKKQAFLLGVSYEHKAQQLFTVLRTHMLDKTLETRLINLFLRQELETLEQIAKGVPTSKAAMLDMKSSDDLVKSFEARRGVTLSDPEKQKLRATIAEKMAAHNKKMLADRDPWIIQGRVDTLAKLLKKDAGVLITPAERKGLALSFTNVSKQVNEAEAGIHRGEWSLYEALRDKADAALSQPYAFLADVLQKYARWYVESKPTISKGSIDDMHVECRVLLEIIGNISIAEVNTMDTVTRLKSVLRKYPLNRQQRYKDKALSTILRNEKKYDVISLKTANMYLKRLKAVIDYANKDKSLNAANVMVGELFRTEIAAEDQRAAYDDADIKRLIDAICTYPLWVQAPAKPERFWIILITIFHGFRLGNICKMTKADICLTDNGVWVFALRTGKSASTVRKVAICDSLLLLGFLEWVEGLKRERLFQDTSGIFSKWYNHNYTNHKGFEPKYVTSDKRKCLYSLRHSFAGNAFDVSLDSKLVADMLGHSTGYSVTARYIKPTRVKAIKETTDKIKLDVDLDRLEERAKELFFITSSN